MGSSTLVIAGIWLAVLGYAVLYTGVAKIGGDSSYHLALAFQGKQPQAPSTGGTGGPQQTNYGNLQQQMIPLVPVT